MQTTLKSWAGQRGLHVAVVAAGTLRETGTAVAALVKSSELDKRFYRQQLRGLLPGCKLAPSRYRSVIILAMPRPAQVLRFLTADGSFDTVIPPTYLEYSRIGKRLLLELTADLGAALGDAEMLLVPLKTLAVRAGLASWGRNNITYVEGLGSYFQLIAYGTTMAIAPFAGDLALPSSKLKNCLHCRICIARCPTGAIDESRFLIRAENCLTLFTEEPGEMPQQKKGFRHPYRCIVGCLACQAACPANRGKLKLEAAPVAFTTDETRCILADDFGKSDPLRAGIGEKLETIGMRHYDAVIGRNLRFLMTDESGKSKSR